MMKFLLKIREEFETGLRNKPASKSAVEKIQDVIAATIQPGITMTQFLEKLASRGIQTKVKVTTEAEILLISYSEALYHFKVEK